MKLLDLNETIVKLNEMGAKKILLQLPDGLKPHVFDYFNKLSASFNIIVSSESFYGACDIGSRDVYSHVDAIVQLGHSEIPNIKYPKPVIFLEYRDSHKIVFPEDIFNSLKAGGYRKIGLLCSVQYIDHMKEVDSILKKMGFSTVTGIPDRRMKYPGQVLGCNFSAAHAIQNSVDCLLIVTTGKFHGIGVQLSTSTDVFILDLNDLSLKNIKDETDRFIRKRYVGISRALDAEKFCVVVDTKVGQYREKVAEVIVDRIREMGREAVILKANEANPTDYSNMRCDAVVFTGCPRVPIDDADKFAMPILTVTEFQMLFSKNPPKRYVMDEIVAVDEIKA
ncbi:diphthamide biosynthesis enzyme Dph2 [Oxyplasma meridianum]|uniref:2-(3-amino-3-carboxypropyl)histidine synthase n=1 Tax=Oxyplasma meridianum TaxID=3073602 RepID=A0AAX4NHG4_9ARCH